MDDQDFVQREMAVSSLRLQGEGWAASHRGLVRESNEDAWLCEPELGLFAVADGMGGHNAGEVASQYAIDVLRRHLADARPLLDKLDRQSPSDDWTALERLVEHAVTEACRALHEMADADPAKRGMGTTLTVLVIAGDQGLMAHVGDSRLYLCRSGQIYQLSEDHTYVWQMLQKGKMTPEEARFSPFSHLLTRAVGQQPQVEVDLLLFDLLPDDALLLCTDGLHDYVAEPTADLLPFLDPTDVSQASQQLIDWALSKGGEDNVTAVAVRVFGEASQRHEQVTLQFSSLQQTTLFRYITYEEMIRTLNVIEVEEIAAGQPIVTEGEEGQELYVLLSGEVVVTKDGQLLRELKPGAHFGEMALINRAPRSASVRAVTACRLLVISENGLYSLMRHEPRIANKIMWGLVEVLSSRLRDNSEALSRLFRENQLLLSQLQGMS